ncbi:MAG: hypothetical protein AAGA91_00770 [Pseudomonadota bacterium]
MPVGSWDPEAQDPQITVDLDDGLLQRFIALGEAPELQQLERALDDSEQRRYAPLMTLSQDRWRNVGSHYSDAELFCLLRFFAVAEQLPGWEAAEKSPVIPLAKILRERGNRPDKAFLTWLRQISDNRFLPYGPL